MQELKDHLQLLCQMIDEDNSNFHCFLQRVKKKSDWLNQLPYGLLLKRKEMAWKRKSDYEPSRERTTEGIISTDGRRDSLLSSAGRREEKRIRVFEKWFHELPFGIPPIPGGLDYADPEDPRIHPEEHRTNPEHGGDGKEKSPLQSTAPFASTGLSENKRLSENSRKPQKVDYPDQHP